MVVTIYVALPDYNGSIGTLLSNISKNICTIVLENIMHYLFFLYLSSFWIDSLLCLDKSDKYISETFKFRLSIYRWYFVSQHTSLHWPLDTLTTCHIHWLLATYIDYLPLTLTTFHLHWLLSTYIDYLSLTLTTCHLHWQTMFMIGFL